MIPIHQRKEDEQSDIVIHKLSRLSSYDSTQAHRHNYFEFFVFEKGGGVHFVDFEGISIESNSIHIVAPGQVHQVKRELNTNGFVFLFDVDVFSNEQFIEEFLFNHICLDVHEALPNYLFSESHGIQLVEIAKKAWNEFNSENKLKFSMVKNHLSELLINCARIIEISSKPDSTSHGLYISFRKKLKEEFKKLKKVKEYSDVLSISEKQLNEIVKQRTGKTASAIIYEQLILEAKRLINAGMSNKEIAYELNFSDPSHFSKFFKNQTSLSTSEFRQMH